jgi:DNA-binding HxlR family transcriptional regulator
MGVKRLVKAKAGESGETRLEELSGVFDAIGNPMRLGLLIVLYGSEILHKGKKHSLGFTDLKKIMEVPSDATLNYHLEKLMTAGLIIRKPFQESPTDRINTVYGVTDKTVRFLKEINLARAIEDIVEEKLSAK